MRRSLARPHPVTMGARREVGDYWRERPEISAGLRLGELPLRPGVRGAIRVTRRGKHMQGERLLAVENGRITAIFNDYGAVNAVAYVTQSGNAAFMFIQFAHPRGTANPVTNRL